MAVTISGTDGISGDLPTIKVSNGTEAAPALTGQDTDSGVFFGTNEVNISTNGSTAATVDSSGNAGIGTTSPSFASGGGLEVSQSSGRSNVYATSGSATLQLSHDGSIAQVLNRHNSDLQIGTNNFERVRIASDGKVRINRISNLFTEQFIVESDTTSVNPMTVSNTRSSAATDYSIIFGRNGSIVGSIQTSLSATFFLTSSDYRLKENIVDISDGITRVKQLQPRRFNFIADADTTVDGFVAHEAQTVVPEAVTGTHNEVDDDGNAVMQGIDQSKLAPLLTAALQEAIAKIETLETKVAALEAAE